MTPITAPNLIGSSGQQLMLATIQIGRTDDEELGLELGLGLGLMLALRVGRVRVRVRV